MRIFINMHYMMIGGAERALLGLLDAIKPEIAEVDLFVNQHEGEFMPLIPKHINLLPPIPEYTAIERPMMQILREGHLGIFARRLMARWRHRRYIAKQAIQPDKEDASIFQYVFDAVEPALPSLEHLGEYDLAISFLHPHNVVLRKVKAKRKVCWIHTDYSTIHVNAEQQLSIWEGYDMIASISEQATEAFLKVFPSLKGKVKVIENIVSADLISQQAEMEDVSHEMPKEEDVLNLLSIGRYCRAKRFEEVPMMCRVLLDAGIKIRWYIVGFGDDSAIREAIDRYRVADTCILLGKKGNPYPYIKACDLYIQPSLYEGKSVTVKEAQLLGKPVVVTNYPTASSQVTDGVDGTIVPLDPKECAEALVKILSATPSRREKQFGPAENAVQAESLHAQDAPIDARELMRVLMGEEIF